MCSCFSVAPHTISLIIPPSVKECCNSSFPITSPWNCIMPNSHAIMVLLLLNLPSLTSLFPPSCCFEPSFHSFCPHLSCHFSLLSCHSFNNPHAIYSFLSYNLISSLISLYPLHHTNYTFSCHFIPFIPFIPFHAILSPSYHLILLNSFYPSS